MRDISAAILIGTGADFCGSTKTEWP